MPSCSLCAAFKFHWKGRGSACRAYSGSNSNPARKSGRIICAQASPLTVVLLQLLFGRNVSLEKATPHMCPTTSSHTRKVSNRPRGQPPAAPNPTGLQPYKKNKATCSRLQFLLFTAATNNSGWPPRQGPAAAAPRCSRRSGIGPPRRCAGRCRPSCGRGCWGPQPSPPVQQKDKKRRNPRRRRHGFRGSQERMAWGGLAGVLKHMARRITFAIVRWWMALECAAKSHEPPPPHMHCTILSLIPPAFPPSHPLPAPLAYSLLLAFLFHTCMSSSNVLSG